MLVEILVLPPFNLIIMAAIGLILLRWRRRTGFITVSTALVLLYVFSTPLVNALLVPQALVCVGADKRVKVVAAPLRIDDEKAAIGKLL